ncbi:MAG: glycosyltransferase family 4 protein [Planctomycetota bacterium]|jgi:glycosyltransferase involved in cell wall biosynthesis|nr:glycosyltransferase family 4 protein [Planctomycetota bacterium]MDP6990045.1 glycosyltransferase family 4 protein [Planctomycetota bacterium]
MRIALLTPGTGHFHCGSCLRDGALATALRALGHDVRVVPLYLPLWLEDDSPDAVEPVRMGGINVFLQHKLPPLRRLPGFVADALDSPALLRWAARRGNMTDPAGLGAVTLAVLEGERGALATEIDKLARRAFPAGEEPDVVILSNAMLLGTARSLRERLDRPLVCTLQGEAPFLDGLPEPYRERAWACVRERAADADACIAVSADYGALMAERLALPAGKVTVVHNGVAAEDLLALTGAWNGDTPPLPRIGYLARMCPDKGLDTLVEAFVLLCEKGRVGEARLAVAGTLLAGDRAFVDGLRARLDRAGLTDRVAFHPGVTREEKVRLFDSLAVLSVPATYGESFGLYVLEALAAGVPVVQPRHAAFPELVEATGGGVLCEPDDPVALADALEALLLDPARARALAESGRDAVRERFGAEHMARGVADVCTMLARRPDTP